MSKWIDQIFTAGSVAKGNIVQRQKKSVEKYASMAKLQEEVTKRKFHLIETGDQVIIICNKGKVSIIQ